MEDAIHVINHHFKISNMICFAEHISPDVVHVYHFNTHPQFGIDEQRIDDLIQGRFRYRCVTSPSNSSKLNDEWQQLFEQIREGENYQKDICLAKEPSKIHLFGLTDLIRSTQKKFDQLAHKHDPQPCRITLSEQQVYLPFFLSLSFLVFFQRYSSSIISLMSPKVI